MRKLAFLFVAFALVAVAFYGCDENPAEPATESTPEATPLLSRSQLPYKRVERRESDWVEYVDCFGEDVHFRATYHLNFHVNDVDEPWPTHIVNQQILHGVGVGQVTGRRWLANDVWPYALSWKGADTAVETSQRRVLYIGQGQTPDLFMTLRYHWTWLAGETVTLIEVLETTCRT